MKVVKNEEENLDDDSLDDDYDLDDNEDDFYSDSNKKREGYENEPSPEEEATETEEGDVDDEYTEFEELHEERDNNIAFDSTTQSHREKGIMYMTMFDETRAALLAAIYKADKKELLFYEDIEEDGEHENLKKVSAILVKKYEDLFFVRNAPEIILGFSILASSGVVFLKAKNLKEEEEAQKAKEPTKEKEKEKAKKHFTPTKTS